ASDTACYRFCSGYLWVQSSSGTTRPQRFLRDFVKAMMLEDGSKNWPTSREDTRNTHTRLETNDNAKAVTKDLTKLTPEEKTIVAGLLAKTIKGGGSCRNKGCFFYLHEDQRRVAITDALVNLGMEDCALSLCSGGALQ
ncbi:P44-86 outer membrane protein, truncated, partial [Anaplasma phagocytophilum str. HZ]